MRTAGSLSGIKGRAALLLMLMAVLLSAFAVQIGTAAESGKVIVLGESLSDADREEMLRYFNAGPEDRVLTITVKETNEAMSGVLNGLVGGYDGVYSSTALTCLDLGDGLTVTTRAISPVTPSMFAMALVTAGIGDARLDVSGPQNSSAYGISAMAGVLKTLEIAPCESGDTSKERQNLAIEQLALTAEIGTAINAIQPAADVILETQKTIVTESLNAKSDIDKALGAKEKEFGISIPGTLREQAVDLFLRLEKADINWSTFASGWEITYDGSSQLTMNGEGIAVENARLTATAEAGGSLTATAEARAAEEALTATAEAEAIAKTATAIARAENGTATAEARSWKLTATAQAQSVVMTATAEARATRDASDSLTATAAAEPTATMIPTPSPTPEPSTLSGTIESVDGNQVTLLQDGASESVSLTVATDAAITRDGEPATLTDLKSGDNADAMVDGVSSQVQVLNATTPPVSVISRITGFWWILPIGAMIPLVLKLKNRTVVEPFVIKRVAAG